MIPQYYHANSGRSATFECLYGVLLLADTLALSSRLPGARR